MSHATRRPCRCSSLIALALAVSVVALFSGCAKRTKISGYRLNPSPEVRTTSRTTDEILNNFHITQDTNMRGFSEDVARSLYINRPMRLSPKPIPH